MGELGDPCRAEGARVPGLHTVSKGRVEEVKADSRWGPMVQSFEAVETGCDGIPSPARGYGRLLSMGAMRSELHFKKDSFGCWVGNKLEG